jgi:hypothetical protein
VVLASPKANWEVEIGNGRFYPVFWEKIVHPLAHVTQYAIVARQTGLRIHWRPVKVFDNFTDAIVAYTKVISNSQEFWFVGLHEPEYLTDLPETLSQTTKLIPFYRSIPCRSEPPVVDQIHDPTVPITFRWAVFLRYHPGRAAFTFYDGALRRIKPGDETENIDLSIFYFR